MSGWRYGLLVTTMLVPGVAAAQAPVPAPVAAGAAAGTIALDQIDIVAVTPVSGTGAGIGSGASLPLSKVPSTVETVTARDFAVDRATLNPLFTLDRRVPGVNLSDAQANSNRQTLTYRGFVASPVQGVPQGLAVYQNGVRINEAFGDVVNWDLIPQVAINRIDIVTGNPVFGLNALGGAVNIEMKNGFTWQGSEFTVLGGSDGRIAGTFQHGVAAGPWSFYFAGEGLRDAGWRFQSPSEIGRVYADVGYRAQDSEFHLIASGANTFFGAAAATPVDLLRGDERAIFTYPQTTSNQVGQIQLNGRVNITPTWDLAGNAYYRRFSQVYVDGNDADLEQCSTQSSYRGFLCLEDDGFTRAPNQTARQFRDQFALTGRNGGLIPYRANTPYGTLDRTRTEASGWGGSLQATNRDRIGGFGNTFIVGGSIDVAHYGFASYSTLGYINPDLSVGISPQVPGVGTVPGIGTEYLRTLGSVGYQPTRLQGDNLYMGLYATDTIDLTDRLSLTAGARLNFARITTSDLTGQAPEINGQHYFTRINPVVGATFRVTPTLSVYGSYSESNRAPTPLELSCANPNRPCLLANSLVADPPLQQVVGQTYEAGLRGAVPDFHEGGLLSYKLGLFRTDLTNDIISLASTIQGRGYFVNVPGTRRQGLEVAAEYASERWSVYANYALIDATFRFAGVLASPNNPFADDDGNIAVRPGNRIPLVPEHQIKAGFTYAVTPYWTVGANAQVFSSSFFQGDESNLNRKLPAYWSANLNTSFRLTDQVELFGLVTNLFNRRYANFGTFAERTEPGELFANRFAINDPRTIVLVQPLSVYGGVRVTW
ncbi:MAG: TonB-dependent receptor [Methylobacterium frigidaeris]